ncbi:MAG TPA: hypothetical protein VJQ58_02440 [Burkholderiales bacterium]|nr:hypothetical protein [Burkholderiales bacterium]
MPRAAELVAGHIYYTVQHIREGTTTWMEGLRIAVHAPVVSTLLYTGTQDEEGSYVFRPLPLDSSEVLIQPDAMEPDLLDLQGLKEALGYSS